MKRIIYSVAIFAFVLIVGVSVHHFYFKKEVKLVALTFDDGPYGSTTDAILNILEQKRVLATFFIIGKNAELYPEQVKREVADGDIVGNHSYSHSHDLPIMASSTLRADMTHAQAIIIHEASVQPHFFRAPYGSTTPQMIQEIQNEGYVFVGWDVDPNDWNNANSSAAIISYVESKVKPNDILLFHDGHEEGTTYSRDNTIQALPIVIDGLKKQGYTFVTVDKLLHTSAYISR